MATGVVAIFSRMAAPFVVGLALAYFLTGFFDRPAEISFATNTSQAKQAQVVEPQTSLLMDHNIFKLGIPLLSVDLPKPKVLDSTYQDGEREDILIAPIVPAEISTPQVQ